jgi:hypothetical protein
MQSETDIKIRKEYLKLILSTALCNGVSNTIKMTSGLSFPHFYLPTGFDFGSAEPTIGEILMTTWRRWEFLEPCPPSTPLSADAIRESTTTGNWGLFVENRAVPPSVSMIKPSRRDLKTRQAIALSSATWGTINKACKIGLCGITIIAITTTFKPNVALQIISSALPITRQRKISSHKQIIDLPTL